MPIDFGDGAFLIDDDLRTLLLAAPRGVRVTCFMDCCHSGTNSRLLMERSARSPGKRRFLALDEQQRRVVVDKYMNVRGALRRDAMKRGFTQTSMTWVSFAACQDWESALEHDGSGDFTRIALEVLSRSHGRGLLPRPAGMRKIPRWIWPAAPADAGARLPSEPARWRSLSGELMSQANELAGGQAATPAASSAAAQTHLGLASPANRNAPGRGVEGTDFEILRHVGSAAEASAYERKSGDPIYRPLRIFALDPSASKRDGAISVLTVPYEPLKPGPESAMFKVVDYGNHGVAAEPLDLERPDMLIQQGCTPSESNPQFRAQMAYAVCATTYAAFRLALGRTPAWQFQRDVPLGKPKPLVIHACTDDLRNAFYDPGRGRAALWCVPGDGSCRPKRAGPSGLHSALARRGRA